MCVSTHTQVSINAKIFHSQWQATIFIFFIIKAWKPASTRTHTYRVSLHSCFIPLKTQQAFKNACQAIMTDLHSQTVPNACLLPGIHPWVTFKHNISKMLQKCQHASLKHNRQRKHLSRKSRTTPLDLNATSAKPLGLVQMQQRTRADRKATAVLR